MQILLSETAAARGVKIVKTEDDQHFQWQEAVDLRLFIENQHLFLTEETREYKVFPLVWTFLAEQKDFKNFNMLSLFRKVVI